MNITQEKIDDLNAVIKVQLKEEDYQDKVENQLKEYRKKLVFLVSEKDMYQWAW